MIHMSEAEKQEGQKTVVAFIAGLLIGGLLVWVFSASPEKGAVSEQKETTKESATKSDDQKIEVKESSDTTDATVKPAAKVSDIKAGDAKLSVKDQPAGEVVVLDASTYPSEEGWVAVRDYMDGVPGKVLGVARFNTTEGLTPTSVTLLRATEAGSSYQVVYYSDNGDKEFDLRYDLVIEGLAVTFKAQ